MFKIQKRRREKLRMEKVRDYSAIHRKVMDYVVVDGTYYYYRESEEKLPPEIIKLRDFFLDKMFLLPKYGTERHYSDFSGNLKFGIYSDAVCIGSNITQDSKAIVVALAKCVEYGTDSILEWSDAKAHKYWKFAIGEALKDFKNKKNGDFATESTGKTNILQKRLRGRFLLGWCCS